MRRARVSAAAEPTKMRTFSAGAIFRTKGFRDEEAAIARARLREEFLAADMGLTGANFLVAETGFDPADARNPIGVDDVKRQDIALRPNRGPDVIQHQQ